MGFNDRFGNRKSKADATLDIGRTNFVDSKKVVENKRLILVRYTSDIVRDGENRQIRLTDQLDYHLTFRWRVLDRVPNQIPDSLAQQRWISKNADRSQLKIESNRLLLSQILIRIASFFDKFVELDGFQCTPD